MPISSLFFLFRTCLVAYYPQMSLFPEFHLTIHCNISRPIHSSTQVSLFPPPFPNRNYWLCSQLAFCHLPFLFPPAVLVFIVLNSSLAGHPWFPPPLNKAEVIYRHPSSLFLLDKGLFTGILSSRWWRRHLLFYPYDVPHYLLFIPFFHPSASNFLSVLTNE